MTAPNLLNTWSPDAVCVRVCNWYAEGRFSIEEAALEKHRAGYPSMRDKARISVDYLHFLFTELEKVDIARSNIRNGLAALEVPVSALGGRIDIEDIAQLYQRFRNLAEVRDDEAKTPQ